MSSSVYSHRTKNDSDISNHSSVKSVEIENYPKAKKKKVYKKKPREILQPPLHFDFNVISSSSRKKEILSISEEEAGTPKTKSVYNYSVTSKKDDNKSTVSTKSNNNYNQNNNTNIIRLPPPSRPNFIRKNQETIVKSNFDDRWQQYLELKKMDQARNHIYFRVYFYKWKMLSSAKFIERIRERTLNFESIRDSANSNQSLGKDKNDKIDDAADLINKARKKYNEYTSFLSEFEQHVSSFTQNSKKFNSDDIITNHNKNINHKSINTSLNKNVNVSHSIIKNENNNELNQNIDYNTNIANSNIDVNVHNKSQIDSEHYQNMNYNKNRKINVLSKSENEEDNFSAFFGENVNNSALVANNLINDASNTTQLCEFDFTDSSDNLLQVETPQPTNSFIEPKPPSENSDSGEIQKSEVQISMDSITVANSFCDMIDNSINRSKELAVKTKTILADESQSSSDIEIEFQDHSFIHEKKRRYISSSSSEDESDFLPKAMIRYSRNHNTSSSLADSFHISGSSIESRHSDNRERKYSIGFPSDLYDEILSPLHVTKVKINPNIKQS